jgi:hypothetical protein
LVDQRVVVDLESVQALALEDYAVEILAHEVGHHVYAPGSAADQFRLLARIRRALPTLERFAPLVANLYTDLYINDRLQRQGGLRMADVYRALKTHAQSAPAESRSRVWTLYMRVYEHLWRLDRGELGGDNGDDQLNADAWLGARLVRVFSKDWLAGAGRFATLLLPYLAKDEHGESLLDLLHDTKDAAEGCEPSGAQAIEDDEIDGAIHPVEDPRINGLDEEAADTEGAPKTPPDPGAHARGQAREPFDYGEILKAAGIKLSPHELAVRYYRERALPHLVSFPTRPSPDSPEPQLEGLEPWEIGEPFDELDWLQTVLQSPRVVPGLTTVRRQYGREPGETRERTPVDLDLYVDSSGSMPNPQFQTSFPALAGAVIALSALRVGARVQVTLWSGTRQFTHTNGFTRDETAVLSVLTAFFGGATAFPIHRLRDTYAARDAHARRVHLLMISDDGITTMFAGDEQGNNGWHVSAKALERGGAGGTMALNVPSGWQAAGGAGTWQDQLRRARREQGWDIHAVERLEDLLEFARAFSRRHYAAVAPAPAPERRA